MTDGRYVRLIEWLQALSAKGFTGNIRLSMHRGALAAKVTVCRTESLCEEEVLCQKNP